MPIQMVKPVKSQIKEYYPNVYYDNQNDLYENMKPLIVLARLSFVLPWSRSAQSWRDAGLRLCIVPAMISTLFVVWNMANAYFSLKNALRMGSSGSLGVLSYLISIHPVCSILMDALVYFHFLNNSREFYKIFEIWNQINFRIHLKKDKWLRPLSFLLILVPLAEVAFYGYLLYIAAVGFAQHRSNSSWLNLVYELFMTKIKPTYYHPAYPIIWFTAKLLNRISTYLISPLIIIFSRTLAFQFKNLIEEAARCSMEESHFADVRHKDKAYWIDIVRKHRALTKLTRTVNAFLSPLLFWWTAFYIYMISIQLFRSLFGMGKIEIPKHIFLASFAVETLQFLVAIIFATKVNTYAVKILNILRNCPREHYYDTEVYRLEHSVMTRPAIALNGMGCFAVEREFLIKIFNAVFTVEIILLQAAEFVQS